MNWSWKVYQKNHIITPLFLNAKENGQDSKEQKLVYA
jgi:hypothetical protein